MNETPFSPRELLPKIILYLFEEKMSRQTRHLYVSTVIHDAVSPKNFLNIANC